MSNATSPVIKTFQSDILSEQPRRALPVSGSTSIQAGAMVCIPFSEQGAGGNIAPLVVNSASLVVGVALESVDTTGLASGKAYCPIGNGVYAFTMSGSIPSGSIGSTLYAADDHTVVLVALTGSAPGMPVAGTVWEVVDSTTVLVRMTDD